MTDKTKLPVIGSSAGSTTFCAAKIEGPGGYLWIDGNQKITAWNGTYEDPKPNAFSLEAQAVVNRESSWHLEAGHEHCPGSTSVCRASCYVHGLEKHAGETYALYRHNSTEIRRILASSDRDAWAAVMANWISANAPGGFRWHVSGDVFSQAYAAFIAAVCTRSPDVHHWIYTRSFDMVEPLVDLDNIALNLSCDRENFEAAIAFKQVTETRQLSTPLQLCFLTDEHDASIPEMPYGSVIFPDYALRGRGLKDPTESAWWQDLTQEQRKMVCPVDFFGKSPASRCGPCRKCLL